MKKYKYNIVNLDCANCARKIEESLNKNPKLNNAIVNFNNSKIHSSSSTPMTGKYTGIPNFQPRYVLNPKRRT